MRQPTQRLRTMAPHCLSVVAILASCVACSIYSPSPQPSDSSPRPSASWPRSKNCIKAPHECGYPDATNTGVPSTAKLLRVPEDAVEGPGWTWRPDIRAVVVGGPNVEISGLDIDNGMIIVYDGGVTIRDVRLTTQQPIPINCAWGGSTRAADSCLGLTIEDSEVIGLNIGCQLGIGFSGYNARRVHISKCQDGFKANSDVVIEDSFVDQLWFESDKHGNSTHNDAVQTTGGSRVTLRHNTFSLGDQPGANAIVQFGNEDKPTISDWLIEDNLMDGGGYTFNARPPLTKTEIKDNRFTRRFLYGIGAAPDAIWSGNIWDDTLQPAP